MCRDDKKWMALQWYAHCTIVAARSIIFIVREAMWQSVQCLINYTRNLSGAHLAAEAEHALACEVGVASSLAAAWSGATASKIERARERASEIEREPERVMICTWMWSWVTRQAQGLAGAEYSRSRHPFSGVEADVRGILALGVVRRELVEADKRCEHFGC